jgi:NTP pyrophosphatase (non-canonical NTP hydrolase)
MTTVDVSRWQAEIGAWSRATFPSQSPVRIGEHLIEEADEVWSEVQAEPDGDVDELAGCAADVVLLLLALADL